MAMVWKTKYMASKLESLTQNPEEEDDEYLSRLRQKKADLWKLEVDDAKARAYLKAIQDAQAIIIRNKIEAEDFEGMPELQELYSQIRNKNGNGGAIYSHYWVTVNVAPGVLLADVQTKVRKYVHRRMLCKSEWVYEQRGSTDDEAGKGLHVHLLVQPAKPISLTSIRKNTYNTFKSLVGNEKCVCVLACKTETDVEKRRRYMSGEKDDDEKMVKCAVDKKWRLKNNLQDMYTYKNGEDELQEEASSEEDDRLSQASSVQCHEEKDAVRLSEAGSLCE